MEKVVTSNILSSVLISTAVLVVTVIAESMLAKGAISSLLVGKEIWFVCMGTLHK